MSASAAPAGTAPPASPRAQADGRLVRLRADVRLEIVGDADGGFPAVIAEDPVRGSYFRVAWPHAAILMLWKEAENAAVLCERLRDRFGLSPSPDEIDAVQQFIVANQLTETDAEGGWAGYARQHRAARHGIISTVIHGYLFFRIPLLHPERHLRRLLPVLAFAYTRTFWLAIAVLAVTGAYLASRQWTALVSSLADAVRLEGLALFAVAVLGLKGIHELGHALTTVRLGCRVPSMGIAFMLGAPVLYTDTSDSWRLGRRADRLAIVFAGVAAEAIVATGAILAWCFIPDGTLRQVCFALATTSVALTLVVNLNPFMRFDGYFALSDLLRVPNLQFRAFALALWRLREVLFSPGHPPPEQLSPRMRTILIAYAVATAIYRLFLYLGIAALVYVMFGKALGIVLALFEVIVFIGLPIWREMKVWWSMRREIAAPGRGRWTLAAVACMVLLAFAPLSRTVEAPAVLMAANEEAIHLPGPARLEAIRVREGDRVAAGDILFEASSSDLRRQLEKAVLEQRSIEFQVRRMHASEKERETRIVLESQLVRAKEKVAGIERQIGQLVIRAPFDGRVVDLDPEVSPGIWLNPRQPLARIVADTAASVTGYLADSELARVATGAPAYFVPEDPLGRRRSFSLSVIAPASDGRLGEPMLAERHGGPIASSEQAGVIMTRQGWVAVRLDGASGDAAPVQAMRGTLQIEAEPASVAEKVWRQLARVLVREQGF